MNEPAPAREHGLGPPAPDTHAWTPSNGRLQSRPSSKPRGRSAVERKLLICRRRPVTPPPSLEGLDARRWGALPSRLPLRLHDLKHRGNVVEQTEELRDLGDIPFNTDEALRHRIGERQLA
jgi:hypothetical protein